MTILNKFLLSAGMLLAIGFHPRALQAEELETLPSMTPPEANIIVRGERYMPAATLELRLRSDDGGVDEELGFFETDSAGALYTHVTLPAVPVGNYSVDALDGSTLLESTPHGITSPPALSLTPAAGPPGTVVDVGLGSVPAGSVELHYDGINVLGPIAHDGGPFEAGFLVPADRPEPLGSPVDVTAIARAGNAVSAVARSSFTSQPPDDSPVELVDYSGPTKPVYGGETFQVSGRLLIPEHTDAADFELSLVWITASDTLIPINYQPVELSGQGEFMIDAAAPSLQSGQPLGDWGGTDELGLVYRNPSFGSGMIVAGPVFYEFYDTQTLKFHVAEDDTQNPIEGAVVRIAHNAFLLPPGYVFDEDGDVVPAADPVRGDVPGYAFESVMPALYTGPNQFLDAYDSLTPILNPVTGCTTTLDNGVTNSQGNFNLNTWPIINYLLDYGAWSVSQLDINTTINGPGPAEFSVMINALHEERGLPNANGACTAQRYDFQFVADGFTGDGAVGGTWKLKDGLNGGYTIPFDPDFTQNTFLPECTAELTTPAMPYMPGIPAQELIQYNQNTNTTTPIHKFGAIWSFPDTNGATFNLVEPPQVRLPHADGVFGVLTDIEFYIEDQFQGVMTPDGMTCTNAGIEYAIELPQLLSMPEGVVDATITGEILGQPFERVLQFEIKEGPTWINNDQDYVSRTINWSPEVVSLVGVEPTRDQSTTANNVPQGVGTLHNDNVSGGTVSQALKPTGATTRSRDGAAGATVANLPTDDTQNTTQPSGGNSTPIGIDDLIPVLDTGKIPLFRYSWGIWPIASATVGADIWFTAGYYYYGMIQHTDAQVLVDLTTAAVASAGLDVWLDVSVILDLVSISAFALPSFHLGMIIELADNQIDPVETGECFQFLLDLAYQVKVGWCPLCVKAGGDTNLIDESVPASCEIPGLEAALAGEIPEPPATDRTSLAVDGLGRSMAVWGDATGQLNVQHLQHGLPVTLQAIPAAPGAMGPDVAYYDADQAVMVWAQSSLAEPDFLSYQGDPGGVMPFQRLVYRTWDGTDWSATQPLTLPTTGDGGVVLAACPAGNPSCPAGGEVLAVWVNDAAADIGQHDLRLMYAFFDGISWTAPAEVDPASTAKDLQPDATYLDGEPVVVWVRNPGVTRDAGGAVLDLNQRRLAYRFLDQPAGVQEPANLPMGVASPSVTPFGNDNLLLAFSVATESDAFIGTRRSLHTAYGIQCFQGTCNWNATERTDSLGRRLFVERPRLVTNASSQAVVTFRQLGTDNPLPGDPTGVLAHTGELAQIVFDFAPTANPVTDPVPLTLDGAVNWHLDSVYDPAIDAVVNTVVQANAITAQQRETMGTRAQRPHGVSHQRLGANGSILMTRRAMLPDFELVEATPSRDWIPPGDSIDVTVRLRNNGPAWAESAELVLAAFWDGPAGLGQPASELLISELVTGATTDFVLEVSLPAGFNPDDIHDLHVVANPAGALAESEGGNNSAILPLGELPVPQNPRVIAESAASVIVVQWDPVDDPRVTGYRVYRVNPDGSTMPVGSSYVPGFADFSARDNQNYEYYMVSHSARLMESAPSVRVPAYARGDLLFADDFE